MTFAHACCLLKLKWCIVSKNVGPYLRLFIALFQNCPSLIEKHVSPINTTACIDFTNGFQEQKWLFLHWLSQVFWSNLGLNFFSNRSPHSQLYCSISHFSHSGFISWKAFACKLWRTTFCHNYTFRVWVDLTTSLRKKCEYSRGVSSFFMLHRFVVVRSKRQLDDVCNFASSPHLSLKNSLLFKLGSSHIRAFLPRNQRWYFHSHSRF